MSAAYQFAVFEESDFTWAARGNEPDSAGDAWSPGESRASDLELLGLIATGDPQAFEALLAAYAKQLASYARRFLGSPDTAQDAVQDVFAHLWENRKSVTVRSSVRAYLYTSVRNRALNIRKRDIAEVARIARGTTELRTAEPADAGLYNKEIAARVATALNSLSPRAREVALLRWRDGLSRIEIASIMGVAVPTVNNQLTLATRTMRDLLRDLKGS